MAQNAISAVQSTVAIVKSWLSFIISAAISNSAAKDLQGFLKHSFSKETLTQVFWNPREYRHITYVQGLKPHSDVSSNSGLEYSWRVYTAQTNIVVRYYPRIILQQKRCQQAKLCSVKRGIDLQFTATRLWLLMTSLSSWPFRDWTSSDKASEVNISRRIERVWICNEKDIS